jgi:hypothetical protein
MSTTAAGAGPATPTTSSPIDAGTSVEVRARFDGRWCAGFEVAERIEADSAPVTYRLRRTSDGSVLPALFTDDDIIAAARRGT